MTQQELETLHALIRSEPWKLVEQVMDEYVTSLNSLDGVDTALDPEALKLEIKARKAAKDILLAILKDLQGYGLQEKSVNPLTRSMK